MTVAADIDLTADRMRVDLEHHNEKVEDVNKRKLIQEELRDLIRHIDHARAAFHESQGFEQKRDASRIAMCFRAAGLELDGDAFRQLCREKQARGDYPETRLIDMVTEGKSSGERRADYAGCMLWIVHCWGDYNPDTAAEDEARAIEAVIAVGGIAKAAELYRKNVNNASQYPCEAVGSEKRSRFGIRTPGQKKAAETCAKTKPAPASRGEGAADRVVSLYSHRQTPTGGPNTSGTADAMVPHLASEVLQQRAAAAERRVVELEAQVAELQAKIVELTAVPTVVQAPVADGINPLELIIANPPPAKVSMSDKKKMKIRELIEKVFYPTNSKQDVISFVAAYHRSGGAGWMPSDLSIGSYETEIDKLRADLQGTLVNNLALMKETFRLKGEVSQLKGQLRQPATKRPK